MMTSKLESAVAACRALAHPARLRVLAVLRSGELCVCQVTEVLELAPSTVSAHLRELRLAGLVTVRKDGRWVHVRLATEPTARAWIETALADLEDDPQLIHDARLVAELRRLSVEDLCSLGYERASSKHRETARGVGGDVMTHS